MAKLFTEYQVNETVFKNRIAMAPMCMYASDETAEVKDFHVIHYATRAMGGASLIIVEATAICPNGRISSRDLGIWKDEQIDGLSKISDQIKMYNAVAGIQLNHAGRKCAANASNIDGPSAIAFSEAYQVPHEMTIDQIKQTVALFKEAAVRAKKAGYEYIEIHAAHGYLLSSFLSPLSNHRTDAYGGSYENRVRIVREVVVAIKSVFDGLIGIRVSACDYDDNGNKVEDIIAMLQRIKGDGIEIVNVSSGAVVEAVPSVYPGYQIPFAQAIKEQCKIPVMGGGLLTSCDLMEEVVSNHRADMVYVGRELIRNPNFVLQVAHQLKVDIDWIESYERGKYR